MSASTDSGSDIDPQAAAQQMRDEAAKRERDRTVDALDNLSTKEQLEQKLERSAQTYPVMGIDVRFQPIGNERVEDVLRLANAEAAQLDQEDIDDVGDVDVDNLEDMPKFIAEMRETLAEACLDEYMAREGLGKVPLEVLQRVFEDVAQGGDLTAEQQENIRKFRNE